MAKLMTHYTLYELEKITGILAATIRVWERRYNIIIPKRTGTNRRWYDDNDLRRLINISIIYHNGIKISKIAKYTESELIAKVNYMTRDSVISDTHIKSLIVAVLSFNGNAVNEILLRSVISIGFEETFSSLIFPFLRRIGIMWHTGSANTGAEHFITNILRGKLIAAIDSLPSASNPKRKRVIMYLPDNELHEIGLLFYSYLIRKLGHEVLYLGQATPFSALTEASEKWHSDIFVTGVLSELSIFKPEGYLHNLSTTFRSQKILLSGSLADNPVIEKYKNLYPIRSVSDLRKHF
ncbi:MAG: MerR family transcriptional regulator [Bacteroidales bacterium]|nr:MerR family transcriptional regulator [Bacteroidales bacterium]